MSNTSELTFWDHLDELRNSIIQIIVSVIIAAIILFFLKEELFSFILAPKENHFITYRALSYLLNYIGITSNGLSDFQINLINTQLASQFLLHVKVSFIIGFIVVLPYQLYVLFRFLSPALYHDEKKYTKIVTCIGYLQFIVGFFLSYFVIFPLTFQFLGTYQVSSEVENIINLESYIETFFMLGTIMGILFEIPIICWLLTKLGLIDHSILKKYRKHAIISILILSAIITPTSDIFTLSIVFIPIYLLYETSVWISKKTKRKKD